MKAMVLAAGRGTRLRPLTDSRPKALVEVGGVPLVQIVLQRLAAAGVREVIINVHHFADAVVAFVEQHAGFGLHVAWSREDELLDTGGGIKRAGWFFRDAGAFLVHNVDVLSDVALGDVHRTHLASGALATLVAQTRPTARPLLFDASGRLCGSVRAGVERLVRAPEGVVSRWGFCGIHVISSALPGRLVETGAFPVIDAYLRLAAEGADVRLFSANGNRWRDAGRPENLRAL